MKSLTERVKDWRKPQSEEYVEEVVTHEPPKVEDIKRREKQPTFTDRIDIKNMLFNMLNQINMNKVSGYYTFSKWEHEDQYLDDCKEFVNRMEILKPDDQFRKEIIIAKRKADEVEQGQAMLAACQSLMIRRKVALPERFEITEYQPDQTRLTEREYRKRDNSDEERTEEDDYGEGHYSDEYDGTDT